MEVIAQRDDAVKYAKTLVEEGAAAVRVMKETHQPETGDYMSLSIFEHGATESKKKNAKLVAHRTRGSVLDELNMSEQDRLELKLKADLYQDILKLIQKKKITPRQLEKLFDIPQPRVSELLRGKLSLLSVSKLLYYANLLGARADVKLKPARQAAWQTRKLNSAEIA
jgi:predicted XRE-type DNA-binding protein